MTLPINQIICDKWIDCYEDGWQEVIVPEAFAHPAKFSYSLIQRIIGHAIRHEFVKRGDLIVDPFGGIGCGGIVAAYSELQWLGVELEQKFVDLANQNFELHRKKFQALNCPQPVIIQGDSRKLCEILSKADLIVSSPPYEGARIGQESGQEQCGHNDSYGTTPGQLGAMKPGKVDAVISSPPYAETLKGDGTQSETAAESRAKRITGSGSLGQSQRTQGYGSKGNLGNLKPGKVDCVVSSPPYERSIQTNGDGIDWTKIKEGGTRKTEARAALGKGYGKSDGQLAEAVGDTFWQAAKEIVEQCYQILKPGGVAIWVVKDFVRNKKRVDFTGDWRRLCESAGFETIHEHHAMLVKEDVKESLFGHKIVKRKERKSFFRRLAESKGSPRIDYEIVFCMRKRYLNNWRKK